MKRNVLIVIAATLLMVIVAWFFLIYSPKGDDLKTAQTAVATEEAKTQDLQNTLSRLQAQAKNASAQQALLRRFDQAIPKTANEGEFIVEMRKIADSAGIEFLSIAPSPPAAGGASSVIALNISISGSFFQVKNYLTKLEKLERLVIIDGMNISAGGGTASTSTGSSDTATLSVSLTARMFTRALPATAPGATPTTPTTPGTGTSSSTAPGGATSSSTAPSGSSTTGGA